MSEQILKSLMHLFAYIAATKERAELCATNIVEGFLSHEVNPKHVHEYMDLYNSRYAELRNKRLSAKEPMKFIARASTKILNTCEEINKELIQEQRVKILVRVLDFVRGDNVDDISSWEMDYVTAIAECFNIAPVEYKALFDFVFSPENHIPDSSGILLIDNDYSFQHERIRHIYKEGFSGQIVVFQIVSVNVYVFVLRGDKDLVMNGQSLNINRLHVFSTGSSVRGGKFKPIYYSDIVSAYNFDKLKSRISFEVDKLVYKFPNGTTGLYNMSFLERGGNLVGIMGASGAGKTTLLSVLNGTEKPTQGQVLVNGIDLHNNKGELNGLIGYVSQDDFLIEELTVFQNLYYAAKQCFDNYSRFKLYRTVCKLLVTLGLYEIRNMVVGSPLNKRISGGQRKRLNIALELIREPSILFLDEPTSGLSSRDSENIMDLLKELTYKGKLVFVVIHQPSSEIFKMFSDLIILDNGGYLVYKGDPVEAITYFKSSIKQVNWNDSECPTCGNVNPEQIFNILESRVIDESGNTTQQRKRSPREWNELYVNEASKERKRSFLVKHLPEINFKIPGFFKQFLIFMKRDVIAKFTNKQNVLINFVESPLIALILSYIIKYRNVSKDALDGYNLLNNCNLPVYIFMAIIVGLFVGLTVSAQEIIKDRAIRNREQFLNLSKGAYLMSKLVILLFISAYQSFAFIAIGNSVLEIHDMYFKYWLMLFAVWVNANIMGLNISDCFKTSVTIYITIPFLIIPQIALTGVLVSFDKLNPTISGPGNVPFYGDMLVARWAYEGLAVEQFINNDYERPLYPYEKQMQNALIKRDLWLKLLENKIDYYERNQNDPSKAETIEADFETLRNEFKFEMEDNPSVKASFSIDMLYPSKVTPAIVAEVKDYCSKLRALYMQQFKTANSEKDNYVAAQQATEEQRIAYLDLKRRYHNEALSDFVTNNRETERVIEYKNKLYQKTNPIYLDPRNKFLQAHFYAPRKRISDYFLETYWVNFIVIWIQTIVLYILLYYRVFNKVVTFIGNIKGRIETREEQKLLHKGLETRHKKSFFERSFWR
ncbi:MAG: ATP-binding cassette domain-containing protein [Bacteroidales bacterium]|nr:ATP-binding cassette domain-containing protein [Bacteroidales bacterium]